MAGKVTLEVKSSVATGAASGVLHLGAFKTVQIGGTFSATLHLEGTIDGSTWTQIGDDITSVGLYPINVYVEQMRVRTSVYGSGTPTAIVGGYGIGGA